LKKLAEAYEVSLSSPAASHRRAEARAAVLLARAGVKVAIVEAGAWRESVHCPNSTYGAMRERAGRGAP
jgi:hypothetical protein